MTQQCTNKNNFEFEEDSSLKSFYMRPGQNFRTISKNKNRVITYKINDNAETEIVSDINYGLTYKKSSYQDGRHNSCISNSSILKAEKVYSKVISIDEESSSAIIEFFLPDAEILRELNPYLFNALKKNNLCTVGSEFYFVTVQKENGLEVLIEPYIPEYNPDIEDMYDKLNEL